MLGMRCAHDAVYLIKKIKKKHIIINKFKIMWPKYFCLE